MSFYILKFVFIILASTLLLSEGNSNNTDGYRAVIRYEDGFLTAGSGGQIDWISVSGKIIKSQQFPGEKFNCLLLFNKMVIAGGDKGSILISSDKGIFRKADRITDNDINSLTIFDGIIIAGADKGEIISGDGKGSFKKTQLALKGNIVSVSSRLSDCYGVTDEGEIIHSVNGINWEITDFNKVYSGYYKPCFFTKVLVTENRIAVAGRQNDDSPVLMFSTRGNVWTERTLNYTDYQGTNGYLADIPKDIFYYDPGDEFYLACSNGKLMKLPSCPQCNKLSVITTDDLEGISVIENTMMVVGGNYFVKAVSIGW